MATLKVGISNMNAVDLAAKAHRVYSMMNGNINFPAPLPDLLLFNSAITALDTAISDAAAFDRNKIAIRNLRNKELRELMRQLAAYVQNVSNGDADKILSSGFELRKHPTPVGVVSQPQNLVARATLAEGEIRLYWTFVNGAKAYEVEYKDMGFTGEEGTAAAAWTMLKSITASDYHATGLTSGHIFQFRVRALGASGMGAWSDLAQERAR